MMRGNFQDRLWDRMLLTISAYPYLAVRLVTTYEPFRLSADDRGPSYEACDISVDASRKPLANLSLICFTVWSSSVHCGSATYRKASRQR